MYAYILKINNEAANKSHELMILELYFPAKGGYSILVFFNYDL